LLHMTDRELPGDAHLEPDRAKRSALTRALRERPATSARNNVVQPLRWWVALTVTIVVAVAACGGGGGKKTDTYAKGTEAQAQCCEHLTGGARGTCLSEIVRVEDSQAASTSTNQATYACVVEHFVCDPNTGKPTTASAQAQYDCIEDQAR
jgi:hypothetical protein